MTVSDQIPRKYGIVVLGSFGFTGTMVCTHIAANFPTNLKWAVEGALKADSEVKKRVSRSSAAR